MDGSFEQLVSSVSGMPAGDVSGGGSAESVSAAAVSERRAALLAAAAASQVNLRARNPKMQFPRILARLATGSADRDCLEYLVRGAAFRGRGSMFGISSLSRIVGSYRDRLPADVLEGIRREVTTYPGFLAGGTENHRAMERTAGLIFGECFPEDTFHHGISGQELADQCTEFVRDYGRTVYASSMIEYLSPVYHATNTAPWLTAAECAQNPEARLMARAIVDWMFADLALNGHHGIALPPLTRCKGQLKGHPGHNPLHPGPTLSTAWLLWGTEAGELLTEAGLGSATVPQQAQARYVPHAALRNLGAKRVPTPFMVLQARANWGVLDPVAANPYDYQGRDEPEYGAPDRRHHLRSVYIDRDYGLGAGYFRENYVSTVYRTSIPFGAVWRCGGEGYNRLIVGHPYWYAGFTPEPWEEPSPEDMWSGMSPFQQVVHWENAAILLFDIPEEDPYRDVRLRWGPSWARPARLNPPIPACFAYYPEAVDERLRTDAGFFLRAGEVYIAIRPLRDGARWAECRMHDYARIDMPGQTTGCVVELGSRPEFGSFAEFRRRVSAAELDTSALLTEKRVTYRSTRGNRLSIRYAVEGWLPDASVNGVVLDFDRWPICESPYVTCRDRVLDINDGHTGFRVDWTGRTPVYTYVRTEAGERVETGREFIAPDGTLRREGVVP